jgi:hypothetical protein
VLAANPRPCPYLRTTLSRCGTTKSLMPQISSLSSSHNKLTSSNKIAQLSARSFVTLRGRTSGPSPSGSSAGWASRMSFLSCLAIQMKLVLESPDWFSTGPSVQPTFVLTNGRLIYSIIIIVTKNNKENKTKEVHPASSGSRG